MKGLRWAKDEEGSNKSKVKGGQETVRPKSCVQCTSRFTPPGIDSEVEDQMLSCRVVPEGNIATEICAEMAKNKSKVEALLQGW